MNRFLPWRRDARPALSVLVVICGMPREAPRTLLSLTPPYQRGIAAADYEIIVVDAGRAPSLQAGQLERFGPNLRLVRPPALPAPLAGAVNAGLAAARGNAVGVLLDGARIASPGLLAMALAGLAARPGALVTPLGWHLGNDLQRHAIAAGYDAAQEDRLLEAIGWPADGYRLFDIAAPDDASPPVWPGPIEEASFPVLARSRWQALGGVDERFGLPTGGFLGRDLFRRALELPQAELLVLLGEGTFHQVHGGLETSADDAAHQALLEGWHSQYRSLRGGPLAAPKAVPLLVFGATRGEPRTSAEGHRQPGDISVPQIDELLGLAEQEAAAGRPAAGAAVAREARRRAPHDPGPQAVLRRLGRWLPSITGLKRPDRARVSLARAEGLRRIGRDNEAKAAYLEALALEPNLVAAHVGLAALRFPGPDYLARLADIHRLLRPAHYLEVGVAWGMSLAQVRSPTIAIGIDPAPRPQVPLAAEVHIFNETSDAFFARDGSRPITGGRPIDLAFIDGLHLFEQALRDFINVERLCAPGSTILLHDTLPLDEPTQRRTLDTAFHSGDVWKLVLCLGHYRPDLGIVTLPAAPTGLTLVRRLDPGSGVLAGHYDEAVARFIDTPFSFIAEDRCDVLRPDPRGLEEILAASE